MRLGAYQLAFLDGVPRYAAVNESVELVRRARLERAVPFTNAVLRRLADERPRARRGAAGGDAGRGGAPALVSGLGRRDVVARPRRRRRAGADAGAERGAGDASSGSSAATIDGAPDADSRAPGTSSASTRRRSPTGGSGRRAAARSSPARRRLARRASGCSTSARRRAARRRCSRARSSRSRSNEARARELEENARRLGATNVAVVFADGLELPAELTGFDRALVDAPCSGLGVLASRPDLRWRTEPLPELQLELLRAAAARVRSGGTVIYSVCTINADESEAVVDASRARGRRRLGEEWPQFRHAAPPEFLQTLPHVHGTSGFFVARLRVPSELARS